MQDFNTLEFFKQYNKNLGIKTGKATKLKHSDAAKI